MIICRCCHEPNYSAFLRSCSTCRCRMRRNDIRADYDDAVLVTIFVAAVLIVRALGGGSAGGGGTACGGRGCA